MKERLESIKQEAIKQIQASDVPEKLNDVRVKFLGKKGELTAVLKGMKDVAPEERPKVGQLVNETRAAIEELLDETKKKMDEKYSRSSSSEYDRSGRSRAYLHRYGIRSCGRTGSRI